MKLVSTLVKPPLYVSLIVPGEYIELWIKQIEFKCWTNTDELFYLEWVVSLNLKSFTKSNS